MSFSQAQFKFMEETVFNQLSLGNEGHVIAEGLPVTLWFGSGNEGGVDTEKVTM